MSIKLVTIVKICKIYTTESELPWRKEKRSTQQRRAYFLWLLLSNRKNKRVTHVWHFQIISEKISQIFFFQSLLLLPSILCAASVVWSTRGDMIFLLFFWRKGFSYFFMTEIVRGMAKTFKIHCVYVNIRSHELYVDVWCNVYAIQL